MLTKIAIRTLGHFPAVSYPPVFSPLGLFLAGLFPSRSFSRRFFPRRFFFSFIFLSTLFRFVARFARVRIEDSSFNRFALNGIQRDFSGGFFPGGFYAVTTSKRWKRFKVKMYLLPSFIYGLHQHSSDWFGNERISVWCKINRKMWLQSKFGSIYQESEFISQFVGHTISMPDQSPTD